jgi:hypothetical protein
MNIVEKIESYLNTYMVFADEDQPLACALWALHTWTFGEGFAESPFTTPYLYINSVDPQSGKTTLIDLLESISLNPERTIDMTSSVMFRLIEKRRPALFIDEIDAISGAKMELLRGVLDGGYRRGGYVWRNAPGPDGPEPTQFKTFCAKLLAGLDSVPLHPAVATRSLYVNLRKVGTLNGEGQIVAPDGTTREICYAYMIEEAAEPLQREIAAFMANWTAHYKRYIPKPIPGINPRSWEIAMPLVQLAAAVGIEDRARDALARMFAPRAPEDTPAVKALRTIQGLYGSLGADKLHTSDICEALGDGWNGRLLGTRVLQPFKIGTPTPLAIGNRTARALYRHQFDDAFKRHL